MLASENPNTVLESVEIESDSESSFSHIFYPYANDSLLNMIFTVRARHPGRIENTGSCATWGFKKFSSSYFSPNFLSSISNNTSTAEFKADFDFSSCPKFFINTVYPMDTAAVKKWDLEADQILKIEFEFFKEVENSNFVEVLLGLYCDKFNAIFYPLKFSYSNVSPNIIKTTPEALNFYSNPNFLNFETFEVEVLHLEDTVTQAAFSSNSFLPLYVASSNPPFLENPNLIKNGSKIKMTLGLNPDFEITNKPKNGNLTFGDPEKVRA